MLTPIEQVELEILRRAVAENSDPKEEPRLPEIRGVALSQWEVQVTMTMPIPGVPEPDSFLENDISELMTFVHTRAQLLASKLGYKKVTEVFFRGRGQWYARLST